EAAKLVADHEPEVRQFFKMLQFGPWQTGNKVNLKTFFPGTGLSNHYPHLLNEDVPSLAVKAFLVTYDYNLKQTRDSLARFARSLCENFPALQEKGHPKWREMEVALPSLGQGWSYYPPTTKELRSCIAAKAASKVPPAKACTQQERILGLCG